jgi:hypothetical protein
LAGYRDGWLGGVFAGARRTFTLQFTAALFFLYTSSQQFFLHLFLSLFSWGHFVWGLGRYLLLFAVHCLHIVQEL